MGHAYGFLPHLAPLWFAKWNKKPHAHVGDPIYKIGGPIYI